jgi:acetyl-CoA carboxylase biotin carboxyl carrier protein
MSNPLDLLLAETDTGTILRSPEVGYFTRALARGSVVTPGELAGVLTQLGLSFELRIPEGARGAIVSDPPDLVRRPVGFGDVLYRVEPRAATASVKDGATHAKNPSSSSSAAHVLRAPQSGRFYHRPAPGEPPFVTAGGIVKDGQPVGMIEVMKTFSHVTWRATREIPGNARVIALKTADGADVKAGDVLLELEPER